MTTALVLRGTGTEGLRGLRGTTTIEHDETGAVLHLDHQLPLRRRTAPWHADRMDVVVEVGGWEHECCGPSYERGQLVALGCVRGADETGRTRLVETHHDDEVDVQVEGRVTDLSMVRANGTVEAITRLPGGEALRGVDPADDGHLEELGTGRRLQRGERFLVTVSPR